MAANFDIVCNRVAVVVEIQIIGDGVAVGIDGRRAAMGGIVFVFFIRCIADVLKTGERAAFVHVGDAVAVGVGIEIIRDSVAVGVSHSFVQIGNRIAVGIDRFEIDFNARFAAIGNVV